MSTDPGALIVGGTYESRGPDPRVILVESWDPTVPGYRVARVSGPALVSSLVVPQAASMWRRTDDPGQRVFACTR